MSLYFLQDLGTQPEVTFISYTKLQTICCKRGQKEIFSQRVVLEWSSLPCDVVEANSVRIFKARFDNLNKDIIYLYD